MEQKVAEKDDEVYHFICYVPIEGKLYELDGLKPGPILLGDIAPNQDWLESIAPHIQQRIERYSQTEIRFNLLGLVRDRREEYLDQINSLETRLGIIVSLINFFFLLCRVVRIVVK